LRTAAYERGTEQESHARAGNGAEGGGLVAYQEQQTRRSGVGGWSRTRWLVLVAIAIAVAVVVLLVLYSGGGSGGGGAGY